VVRVQSESKKRKGGETELKGRGPSHKYGGDVLSGLATGCCPFGRYGKKKNTDDAKPETLWRGGGLSAPGAH